MEGINIEDGPSLAGVMESSLLFPSLRSPSLKLLTTYFIPVSSVDLSQHGRLPR